MKDDEIVAAAAAPPIANARAAAVIPIRWIVIVSFLSPLRAARSQLQESSLECVSSVAGA